MWHDPELADRWTNRARIVGWSGAGLLLLLPLVFKAPWTASDFLAAGAMLGTAGLILELAVRLRRNLAYRLGAGVAVFAALFLVWANLAVGVIGDEGNPANLMYAGVLAVGLLGSVVAGFRPIGMAWAMSATALAMAVVAGVAVAAGQAGGDARLIGEVLGVTGMFVVLFLTSAGLFRWAARADARPAGS